MPAGYLTVSRILILVAIIIFVLAAVGVASPIALVPAGLAVWAAAGLFPHTHP